MTTDDSRRIAGYDALEEIKVAVDTIPGVDRFAESCRAFVRGETDIDQAVTEMMEFFEGDIGGGTVERRRLIELARELNVRYGTVSVMLLTFSSCTHAMSCSYACC